MVVRGGTRWKAEKFGDTREKAFESAQTEASELATMVFGRSERCRAPHHSRCDSARRSLSCHAVIRYCDSHSTLIQKLLRENFPSSTETDRIVYQTFYCFKRPHVILDVQAGSTKTDDKADETYWFKLNLWDGSAPFLPWLCGPRK